MGLRSYHMAWLRAHPDRTEGWLRKRLADGFDIHHLDGDALNDDPSNLVLIEHMDHMMLHHGARRALRANVMKNRRDVEQQCYLDRLAGKDWKAIQAKRFPDTTPTGRRAWGAAERYARRNKLQWPIMLEAQPHFLRAAT